LSALAGRQLVGGSRHGTAERSATSRVVLGGDRLLRYSQIPFQENVLSLCIPHNSLTVASKLRVMGRKEKETREYSLAEGLDNRALSEL
jgi:hypothetical protein